MKCCIILHHPMDRVYGFTISEHLKDFNIRFGAFCSAFCRRNMIKFINWSQNGGRCTTDFTFQPMVALINHLLTYSMDLALQDKHKYSLANSKQDWGKMQLTNINMWKMVLYGTKQLRQPCCYQLVKLQKHEHNSSILYTYTTSTWRCESTVQQGTI